MHVQLLFPFLCRLMKQLAADCALMEELRVMDYSLLLGVHYRSPGYASSPQVTDKVHPATCARRSCTALQQGMQSFALLELIS